ncbi:MAG: hypothetical protein CVU47_00505 [Chloroflexi bacterium HGW-Chloroflexi-9]|nr:MAG: hypothetical protein CVU47_00505 [Chloroflexi bacterium HGW-Chloroflexi-9]
MMVRCGWTEILDPHSRQTIARGLLFVRHTPLPYPMEGWWAGEIMFLRGEGALDRLSREIWVLGRRQGSNQCWIQVTSVEPAWVPSGLRATAHITSYDEEFPAFMSELGGDG